MWDQNSLERYIRDQIQESSNLEYKAADSLSRTDSKMKEISKDISAMANSSGGLIIYGIREFDQTDKKHLPERLDGIDRTQFSKEWLEQVINNIRPRISNVAIHPVDLDSAQTHVAYVVEVPQSSTAHQATDWRYYKRFNFQAVPMEDYEIRDVMNRASIPEVTIQVGVFQGLLDLEPGEQGYRGLRLRIKNESTQVVERFKLTVVLKYIGWHDDGDFHNELIEIGAEEDKGLKSSMYGQADGSIDLTIIYKSDYALFPGELVDIGSKLKWAYPDPEFQTMEEEFVWSEYAGRKKWVIEWKLFADDMPFKEGVAKVSELPVLN